MDNSSCHARPNDFAFIDGVNLHFTYENLDLELDYAKVRNYLRKKFNVTVAYHVLGRLTATQTFVKPFNPMSIT